MRMWGVVTVLLSVTVTNAIPSFHLSENESFQGGRQSVNLIQAAKLLAKLNNVVEVPRDELGNINIGSEEAADVISAQTADGRDEMKPDPADTLDEDCDSPQLGESEPWPSPEQTIDATMLNNTSGKMKEQDDNREVVFDEDESNLSKLTTIADPDHPGAFSGRKNWHWSEFTEPVDPATESTRLKSLPDPSEQVAKKLKCSRSKNHHDIVEPFDELDEDCGDPEPAIPCETEGNSTQCAPTLVLKAPHPPAAEIMPSEPISIPEKVDAQSPFVVVSVELVDFGITRDIHTNIGATVGMVIQEAGAELGISAKEIQLARSGGADINMQAHVAKLPDRKQLIVYLGCVHRRFLDKLLMTLPACEEFTERRYVAHVEVPAYGAIYDVSFAHLNETFDGVFALAPLDFHRLEKVTYRGKDVQRGSSMRQLGFHNDTAFVVYVKEPCPTQTASPSVSRTPTSSPSPSPSASWPSPTRQPSRPPFPGPANKIEPVDTHPFDYPPQSPGPVEIIKERGPMIKPAVVVIAFQGREIPVKVLPSATGRLLFDAVHESTGKDPTRMKGQFHNWPIEAGTLLKAFGLRDGERIQIAMRAPNPNVQHPR